MWSIKSVPADSSRVGILRKKKHLGLQHLELLLSTATIKNAAKIKKST